MTSTIKIYDITSGNISKLLQTKDWLNEFTDIDGYGVEYSPYDELRIRQLPDIFAQTKTILVLISRNNKLELFQYTRYKQPEPNVKVENELYIFKYTKDTYFMDVLDESNSPLLQPFAKAHYSGNRVIVSLLPPQEFTENMKHTVYIRTKYSTEPPTRHHYLRHTTNINEGVDIEYV